MKNFVCIILFLFSFSFLIFADEQSEKVNDLEGYDLEVLLLDLLSKIDNLKNIVLENNSKLNIINYDAVFSHWFSIQQILIAILGGLSLLLPLLTYLFGYKPAKDAEERLKVLETNFDTIVKKRLEKYIENKEINDMKTAIKNLLSGNSELVSQAVNYINYNPHIQIDDIDRKKIYDILLDNSTSEHIKYSLYIVLANKKSIWADAFFDYLLTDQDVFQDAYLFIVNYLLLNTYSQKKEKIIAFLKNCKGRADLLFYFIVQGSLIISDRLFYEVINDEETLSIFTHCELKELYEQLKNAKLQFPRLKIDNSVLCRLVNMVPE